MMGYKTYESRYKHNILKQKHNLILVINIYYHDLTACKILEKEFSFFSFSIY